MQTILLVGPPNSGKSTVFNLLTGENRKIGNFSGVTVDTGMAEMKNDGSSDTESSSTHVVDLPGINTFRPQSLDEGVTVSTLLGVNKKIHEYNQVAVILDFNSLESTLSLLLELNEHIPGKVVLLINKVDNQSFFSEFQRKKLESLLGVKVLCISALSDNPKKITSFLQENLQAESVKLVGKLKTTFGSLEYMPPEIKSSEKVELLPSENDFLHDVKYYHEKARFIIQEINTESDLKKANFTEKIDKFLIHPLLGPLVFCSIFYAIFHAVYTLSVPFMDLIDEGFGGFGSSVSQSLPEGLFQSLIVDGIIGGVGGVIIFLPQIMILFFLLSLLEQSGYISRASFITDKFMGFFGLSGRSFLPYMSGLACSIPAIMATRSIPNKHERLVTIMTIPLMTCSARLPVYALLVGTFIPSGQVLGIFNTQALSFFFLYFLGTFFALVVAKVLRLSFFKKKAMSFFMDLPLYQRPSLKVAIKQMYIQGMVFVKKAGSVILLLSILIWAASTFPKPTEEMVNNKSDQEVAAISLEHSLMGRLGQFIEPAIEPLGFNWKMGVGILAAFGARELFVSTLGTIYALGDVDEESSSLRSRLKNERHPVTGEPVYNMAVAWSLLIFFVFALQCISTLGIVKKETKSNFYPVAMFLYMGVLGYIGSLLVFQFFNINEGIFSYIVPLLKGLFSSVTTMLSMLMG